MAEVIEQSFSVDEGTDAYGVRKEVSFEVVVNGQENAS